jgi:hypothetical protein
MLDELDRWDVNVNESDFWRIVNEPEYWLNANGPTFW